MRGQYVVLILASGWWDDGVKTVVGPLSEGDAKIIHDLVERDPEGHAEIMPVMSAGSYLGDYVLKLREQQKEERTP